MKTMLTILATLLAYLANISEDRGWDRLTDMLSNMHCWVDGLPACYNIWKTTLGDKVCTLLWNVSTWFEDRGTYNVSSRIDELRWWFEGVEARPSWLRVATLWQWYKRTRWFVLAAGPVLLLLLMVVSIYLTMIQMAFAVVFAYLGPTYTLAALWFATSVFWCTIGFKVGRIFKL